MKLNEQLRYEMVKRWRTANVVSQLRDGIKSAVRPMNRIFKYLYCYCYRNFCTTRQYYLLLHPSTRNRQVFSFWSIHEKQTKFKKGKFSTNTNLTDHSFHYILIFYFPILSLTFSNRLLLYLKFNLSPKSREINMRIQDLYNDLYCVQWRSHEFWSGGPKKKIFLALPFLIVVDI